MRRQYLQNRIPFLIFHFHDQGGGLILCQLVTADEKMFREKKKHLVSMSDTQEEFESRKKYCLWHLEEREFIFQGVIRHE